MHLFKSFIQDLDTSLSALPDNIELILFGDFNVNFTGSNLNIDKAMKRKLIQVTNSHELGQPRLPTQHANKIRGRTGYHI